MKRIRIFIRKQDKGPEPNFIEGSGLTLDRYENEQY